MALHALYEVVSCSLSSCFCAVGADGLEGQHAKDGNGAGAGNSGGKGDAPVGRGRTSTAGTFKSADNNDSSSSPGSERGGGGRRRDRRAMGLSLRDGEWDVLFEDDGGSGGPQQQQQQQQGTAPQKQPAAASSAAAPARDLEYADVAARARMAAKPSRHRTPTKGSRHHHHEQQRQRAAAEAQQQQRRESQRQSRQRASGGSNGSSGNGVGGEHHKEKRRQRGKSYKSSKIRRTASSVFRLNRVAQCPSDDRRRKRQQQQQQQQQRSGGDDDGDNAPEAQSRSVSGSFFDAFGARIDRTLCFANPIRDDSDQDNGIIDEEGTLAKDDEEQTLNTCEDTITSTLYFEQKLGRPVDGPGGRPPQPLFDNFRVHVNEERTDEIRRIIEGETHRSRGPELGIVLAYQEMERKKILLRRKTAVAAADDDGEGDGGDASPDERDDRSPRPDSSSSAAAITPPSTPSPPRQGKATTTPTAVKTPPTPPPPPQSRDAGRHQQQLDVIESQRPKRPTGESTPPSMKLSESQSMSCNSVLVGGGSP